LLPIYKKRLFDFGPDYVLARAYYRLSPARKLAKDPLPRLALAFARTFVIVAAKLGIAVAQTTIVIVN
jgi:hypothetical protein